jgi:tetratricopeptide (TPR) repeat protein
MSTQGEMINGLARVVLAVIFCTTTFLRPAHLHGQETNNSEAMRHFQLAHQAQDRGELEVAAQEYRIVTRLEPGVGEAYASLGLVYNALAQFEQSARALEKADKLKPGLPGVDLYLGLAYLKLHDAERAVPRLQRAVRTEPTSKQAQGSLGTALWNTGQTAQSLAQLEKANRLFAADPEILFLLGEAYRKAADQEIDDVLRAAVGTALIHQVYGDIYSSEQDWSKAIGHYQRAITLDPHWAGAHLALADIYIRQGKTGDAEQELHLELEVDPHSAAADAKLAEIALLTNRPAEALAFLDEALRSGPAAAVSALGLPPSKALAEHESSAQAQEYFPRALRALQDAPDSPSVRVAVALMQARLGNSGAFNAAWQNVEPAIPCAQSTGTLYEKALVHFDCQMFDPVEMGLSRWIESHPHDLEAHYLLGRTYRLLSLTTLTTLLNVAPDSYRTHQLLAETYQNQKNDEKALAEYRIVEQDVPNLPGLHFSIGNLLWANGQSEQATGELEKELRIDANHPEANAELGEILVAQQKPEAAIGYLEKALHLDPDLAVAHKTLGQAYLQRGDLAKAEAELLRATVNDPEGEAHYQLGLVYRAMGRSEAAQQQFAISRRIKADRIEAEKKRMMQDGTAK